MSSAGAQCNHIAHVSTQMPYALTAAAISFVSYIIAGFAHNAAVCLIISFVIMVLSMFLLRYGLTGKSPFSAKASEVKSSGEDVFEDK